MTGCETTYCPHIPGTCRRPGDIASRRPIPTEGTGLSSISPRPSPPSPASSPQSSAPSPVCRPVQLHRRVRLPACSAQQRRFNGRAEHTGPGETRPTRQEKTLIDVDHSSPVSRAGGQAASNGMVSPQLFLGFQLHREASSPHQPQLLSGDWQRSDLWRSAPRPNRWQ